MIHRVYENAQRAKRLDKLMVATDHEDIMEECLKNGIPTIMTSTHHINGTERCGEVISKTEESFDVIINIQGDEPFIHAESIDKLINLFIENPQTEIGTLVKNTRVKLADIASKIANPSYIKVALNQHSQALYFSRSMIPHIRDIDKMSADEEIDFKLHIGMYGFKTNTLKELLKLKESKLEGLEKLEQLRWLESGYSIAVAETPFESKSIDTMDDYNYVLENITKFIYE